MHKKPARVSYTLVTLNRADYLERALENIRAFITPEDELIIVDGGSTDRTPEVIASNRDIVSDFFCGPDRGEAHAQNKAILCSNGKYIKLLTDDDYFYPDAVREAIQVLEEHPDIDALQCGGEHYLHDPVSGKTKLRYYAWLPENFRWNEGAKNLLTTTVCCGLGLWITRRALPIAGLLDTSFVAVDTEYIARLLSLNLNYVFVNVKLYRHTLYSHSVMQNRVEFQRDNLRVRLRHKCWDISPTSLYPVGTHQLEALSDVTGISGADLKEMSRILYCLSMLRSHPWLRTLIGKPAWLIAKSIWGIYARLFFKPEKLSPPFLFDWSSRPEPVWDVSLH
jgi:glycosyltransferase involved in cell wall biosynthesis